MMKISAVDVIQMQEVRHKWSNLSGTVFKKKKKKKKKKTKKKIERKKEDFHSLTIYTAGVHPTLQRPKDGSLSFQKLNLSEYM